METFMIDDITNLTGFTGAYPWQEPGGQQHNPDVCPHCGIHRSRRRQIALELGIPLKDFHPSCPDCLAWFQAIAEKERKAHGG